MKMKFEIKNRWSGDVQFTADIECGENSSYSLKFGMAVKHAISVAADLTDADLTGAGISFVQAMPDLDVKILAAIKSGGVLKMDNWHSCETTHCRAGWAITLHPAGKTLESVFGPSAAGALIYAAAYPKMKVPDFNASNEDAMADIEARAALTP